MNQINAVIIIDEKWPVFSLGTIPSDFTDKFPNCIQISEEEFEEYMKVTSAFTALQIKLQVLYDRCQRDQFKRSLMQNTDTI